MPQSVTRTVLTAKIRARAGEENSERVTDAELNELCDDAARQLYAKLVEARGQEYYTKITTLTVSVAGTQSLVLPDDFWQLIGVQIYLSNYWYDVQPFDWSNMGRLLNDPTVATSGEQVRYRLGGTQKTATTNLDARIHLYPTIPVGAQVLIAYIPVLANELVSGEVTYDGIQGFDQWIVYWVVHQIKLNDNDPDAGGWLQLLAAEEQLIQQLAGKRDASKPARVVDRNPRDWWPYPVRRWTLWHAAGSQSVRNALMTRLQIG